LTENPSSRDITITSGRLRLLARRGYLNAPTLERSLQLLGRIPDRRRWERFLNTVLLVLGALFLLSGIFFFFAFNWADMHRFAKLGVIQAALLIAVALAHWLGLRRLTGKIALCVCAGLVGALLAVFGQAYQTGADSYQLFANWAVLTIPWVLIGAFAPLWLLWLGLLNVAFYFIWEQLFPGPDMPRLESLFLLNAAALAVWEVAHRRGVAWLRGRWFAQVAALVAFALITIPTVEYIFGWDSLMWEEPRIWLFAPLLYLAFLLAVLFYYGRVVRDLFMLTLAFLSLIVVITAGVARLLQDVPDTARFLSLALLVIGLAALAVMWLRRVQRAWEASAG